MLPDRLPEVIVIGAMKCATSAVHRYLDAHPDVAMSEPKELNFFSGPAEPPPSDPGTWWSEGQWHRGISWYAAQFDPSAKVRGESSPAYTSPAFPKAPARMAATVPEVRLVYLVRDPVDRALSQYAHHVRDGTERRPAEEALLDPSSQYLARSRYHERVSPYLSRFPRDQIHVIVQERLEDDRKRQLALLYEHVGVEPYWRDDAHARRFHVGTRKPNVPAALREEFRAAVQADTERLRALLNDDLIEWSDR